MKLILLQPAVRLCMKLSVLFYIVCLSSGISLASNSYAQTISQVKISLNLSDVTITEALKNIEASCNFKFVYSKSLTDNHQKISLKIKNASVEYALRSISKQVPIAFKQLNQTIAISIGDISETVRKSPISGIITDEKGQALPGALVKIKGTEVAVATDLNGRFSIEVPNESSVLLITYIGYKLKEVFPGNSRTLQISLEPDATGLNEVVVIGYGTQRKRDLTGAVGKLRFNDIKDQAVANFDQAITGKLAGVQMIQTGGEPGRASTFRIRGTGSITAGNTPLIVLDGIPLDAPNQLLPSQLFQGRPVPNPSLELVNVNDIASIEVLKDAAASAIYGSRGANGVVLITTKRGSIGKLKINYSNITGVQQVSKKMDLLDAYQFAELAKEAHDNAWVDFGPNNSAATPDANRGTVDGGAYWNQTPADLYPYLEGQPGLTNTDWQDEIFRNALISNQTLNFSGGNDKITYYVSGNYTSQNGVVINSNYKRYSARINLDVKDNRLKFGLNFTPSFSRENRINNVDQNGVISSALQMQPNWTVYNANGTYNFEANGKWRVGKDYQHNTLMNPVALANLTENSLNNTNLLGRVYLGYQLLKGLDYEIALGSTLNSFRSDYYRPSVLPNLGQQFYLTPSNPIARTGSGSIYNWIMEQTLNYSRDFGKHHFKSLGGFTAQKNGLKQNSVTATNFPNDLVHTINAGQVTTSEASIEEWSLLSSLGRLQYDYNGKYLASFAIRADGSSRFGKQNKWGYFPSISAGWNISSEKFMKIIPAISALKLRGSYGLTGNFQIGNYESISSLNQDNYILGSGNGQNINGLAAQNVANQDLSWEKSTMLNVGLDAGLFNQRFTLELDWYNRNTSDLLLNVPIPLTTGFGTSRQNVGKVNNRGLELALTSNQKWGSFSWNASGNISFNKNTVKALGPGNTAIIQTAGTANTFFITQVGAPIGSYYFLKENGVYRNQVDLDANPHFAGAKPGDFKFFDVDGDGVLDVNKDRTIVGDYFPDYTFGLNNTFSYKGFDLNASLYGVQGVKVVNLLRRYTNSMEGNTNTSTDALARWRSESDPGNGLVNRANRKAKGNNGRTSTWHVEDGSFIRLQTVSLGYTIPENVTSRLKLGESRIFITGQNLFTWTKYSGFNPEPNLFDNDALTPGIDYGTYPLAKTFSAGINLNF